jgi:anthranilate phosphoribosyltransferase
MSARSPLEPSDAFTVTEARAFMEACLDPASDPQAVGQALVALNCRPFLANELTAFAQVLLERVRPFTPGVRPVLDTCGTGGDARHGVHTANLSTLSALALAGMGVDVVKHGSRAASSRCGSADLLEALGLDLERPQALVEADLARTHFAFLFAPRYHTVLARMVPIRRALGVPTVFNMLGPLANPARPEYQVLGVAREEWIEPVAAALATIGLERALVVHGLTADGLGMDEASLEGPTFLQPVREGRLLPRVTVQPREAGLQLHLPPQAVASKDDCVALALGLAGGRRHPDFSPRVAEEVALQAALGLMLVQDLPVSSLAGLVAEARAAVAAGLRLQSLLALAA